MGILPNITSINIFTFWFKKAGLCEYFKAGHTAEDYKKLIDSAYTPKELLMEWPRHWDGMPDKRLSDAIKVALSLAASHLDEIEQEELLKRIKKATGFSIKKIRYLFQKAANKVNTKTSDSSTKKLDNQQLYDFITTKYGSRLRLNIMGQKIELDGEELDLDAAYIHLLKYEGIDASKYFVADVFKDVARQNPYSPVTEYLDQVSQIAIPVNFDHLCSRYFGTNNPLFNLFLKKTLIAAVARAYDPGCKVDTALVLQGQQGMGKSSFFKVLGGKWFDDSMGDGRDKDDLLILDKCWIQEWSEIERVFGRRQAGELKAFLSRNIDNFREPYGRCTKEFPRHSIIVGTVNNAQFLIDITGNRRYWVIPVLLKAIDLEMLRRERDGIWAAAVQAYKAGETWWLSQEEEAICEVNNEQFRVTDEWETMVANYLEEKERVSIAEILERCFNYEPGKMERSAQMRVANILPSLGWKKVGIKQYQGKRQQCWEKELPVESDYFSTASETKVNSNFSSSNFVTSQPKKMTEVVTEVVQQVVTAGSVGVQGISQPAQPAQPFDQTFCEQSPPGARPEKKENPQKLSPKVVIGCDVVPSTENQGVQAAQPTAQPTAQPVNDDVIKNKSGSTITAPPPEVKDQATATELRWLLQFFADLESDPQPHPRFKSAEHLFELFNEAEEKSDRVKDEIEAQIPNFNERLANLVGEVAVCFPDSEEIQPPSIGILSAELLACLTLAELKAITFKYSEYPDLLAQAYQELSAQEQLKIDAIKATAISQEVFKYTGQPINENGQTLRDGALVYLDPNSNQRISSGYVKVWLLNGINKGWQKAISVSRDFLTAVEKTVDSAASLIEGNQGELFGSA